MNAPENEGIEDVAPPWASALLVTLNEMRAEVREQFDAFGTQLDDIGDRLDLIAAKMEKSTHNLQKNADELEQANAAFDRIIAQVTGRGRAPDGRGE